MKPRHKTPAKALAWRAPEFLFKKKTLLWYTNVTIFFFLVLVIFFLLKQWIAIAIVAFLFWFFISKSEERPPVVDCKIDKTGITIGERTIEYGDIRSFSIDIDHTHPILVFNLDYPFALPVTMLVKEHHLEEVVDYLADYLPLQEEFSLTQWLTHWLHY